MGSIDTGDDIVCGLARAGAHLFTASFASIRVWQAWAPYGPVHTFRSLNHWVRGLAVSADENLLVRFVTEILKISASSHHTSLNQHPHT